MRAIDAHQTATIVQTGGTDQWHAGTQPGASWLVAQQARFLLILVLAAFVLRAIAAIGLDRWLIGRGGDGFLEQDDRTYDQFGWQLAQAWQGIGPGVAATREKLVNAYIYTEAGVYFLFGHHPLAMKLVNCLLGALVAGLVYLIARRLFGHVAGAFAGAGAALFPSTFLWSLTNLKDTMFLFAVAMVMWFLTVLLATGKWRLVLPLVGALALVGSLRSYVLVVLAGLTPGAMMVQRSARLSHKWSLTAVLSIGVVALLWFSGGIRWFDVGIDQVNAQRSCAAYDANSAYAPPSDIACSLGKSIVRDGNSANAEFVAERSVARSTRELVAWMPIGLWHVLAAPFPWAAESIAERATIPEMIAWYAALALAVVAIVLHWRRWRDYAHLLGYLGTIAIVLALTQGNLGTLVRHRAMLIPVVLVFSGAGAAWLWTTWHLRRSHLRSVPLDTLTTH